MSKSRSRVSRFLVVALSLALLALATGAPLVAAKGGGNSPNAKACQKGDWMELQRSDGTLFATEKECTSYAAQGGTLEPKPVEVLDQSQTEAGGRFGLQDGTGWAIRSMGQSFTAGVSGDLTSVALWPRQDSSGWTLQIRTVSGGVPSTTVLASQTITSTTSFDWMTTTFSTPAPVVAGTQYAIVVTPPSDLFVDFGAVAADAYAGGAAHGTLADSVSWTINTFDLAFKTYVTP